MDVSVIVATREAGGARAAYESFAGMADASSELVEVAGRESIGEVYAEGVKQAQGDVVVLMHDDVRVLPQADGHERLKQLLALVRKPSTGVVGLAGTRFLSESGVWWMPRSSRLWTAGKAALTGEKTPLAGSVMHEQNGECYTSEFGAYGSVAVVDGLFMATATEKARRYNWHVGTSNMAWHFYDLSYSVWALLAGYENWVVRFPVFHGSVGDVSQSPAWNNARVEFCRRSASVLPCTVPFRTVPWELGLLS